MPVYQVKAPNGKIYKVNAPEGARQEDLFGFVRQQMLMESMIPPAPKEQAGFWGAFKDSVVSLGLADEAAVFAANPTEENRKAFLDAAESKYRYAGGFGTGENWNTFRELLGGSLGALVAPVAAGIAGAGAGPVGAIGGFAGASAAQYSIQNLQRQAEAQQEAAEKGLPVEDIDLGKAAIASAAQAGLDVIPGALILKGLRKFPLAQKLLAEDKVSEEAANILIDAFQKGNVSRTGSVVKGIGLGASFEIPQEVAQQALERWQAGLSLTDDEAKEEFKQAAIGAAILGGGFGAIGGYATYRGTKAEGERVLGGVEEDAEIEAQREEELQRMREGELEEEGLREAPPPEEVSVEEEDAEIEAQRQAEFEQMRQAEEERLLMEQMGEAPSTPRKQATAQPQLDESLQRDLEQSAALGRSYRIQNLRQQRPDLDSGTIDYLIEEGLTDKQILRYQVPEERGEPLPYEDEEGLEITPPPTAKVSAEATAAEQAAAPDPRAVALEVIKTTPTIKAISEATGLNQPQAAAIMRGFVDEGIVERVGNKFRLITPEVADVSLTAPDTSEVDATAGGRGDEVPPLGPATVQRDLEGPEPTGLDGVSDVTERADVGEGDVSAPLETAGVLEGEGVPTDTGFPSEAFATTRAAPQYKNFRDAIINIAKTKGEATPEDLRAAFDIPIEDATRMFKAALSVPSFKKRYDKAVKERSLKADLRTRALDFIRRTGRGDVIDLQVALNVPMSEAKALRSALLGSGAVVQKSNVKAAKTAKKSYFVVEGDYKPEVTERGVGRERLTGRGEAYVPEGETAEERAAREQREQEQKELQRAGMAPYVEEEKISEVEERRREADKAAEKAAALPRELPPTLKPEIGKGEYGLRYTDKEGNTVYRAYESVGERNEARANLAKEGNKNFGTFSRMAEVAKFELDYARQQTTPAMTPAQVKRAVEGIRAGMAKLRNQLGLFTEAEAPTPKKPAPKRVTRKEVVDYANEIIKLARDSGKLKRYSNRLRAILYTAQQGEGDLRDEFNQLQRIETNIRKSEAELGEATQAALEDAETGVESVPFETVERRSREGRAYRVKGRGEAYKPLDFRNVRFSKKPRSTTVGMRADAVRNLIDKVTTGWKNPPNFTVVQSYLDLPEGLNVEENAEAMGFAVGNDVYIVADNINKLSDLKAAVFHESLGHYGLEQLFGERLFQTMLDIYNTNNRMRADADAWLAENPDTYPESEFTQDERRALATEEIFAEMSESGQIMRDPKMRSAYNRVAALIRKFARALSQLVGKNIAYTNAEINDIIAQAHNKVISGKTRMVPRYNNIRYMQSTYKKVFDSAMRQVQSGAPSATKRILEGNIGALSELPRKMRSFKLGALSLHHMMQLYESYAPALRRLNLLVERMAKDVTDLMVEHVGKVNGYRKIHREHKDSIDEFNNVAHLIHLSQAPVFELELDKNFEFKRFVPSKTAKRMLNIQRGTPAYDALSPNDKVLHNVVNRFYQLPPAAQQMMLDVYTDYRRLSDEAFKVKLDQFLKFLPAETAKQIRKKFMDNRLTFYLPLRREGVYKLSYRDNKDRPVSRLFTSEAARTVAREKAAQAGGKGFKEDVLGEMKYGGGTPPTGLLGELGKNVEEALKNAKVDDATIEDTKRILFDTFIDYLPGTYGNDLRQEAKGRKTWEFNGVTYYGILGFDEDVIGIYETAIPKMLYQINNLRYTMPMEKVREKIKEQFAAYKANRNTDPKYRGVPVIDDTYVKDVEEDIDKRIKFAKNPYYSGYVYQIARANYIYSIAANTSSALINMTIVPMMAWPSLAAKYGVVDASRAIAQATKMFFRNAYRDPQTGQLRFNMAPTFGDGATGEFADFHRMLEMRSVTGTAAEQELNQAQNIEVPGYEGLSAKVNLAMSYVFRSSERYNREVTSLAAYMLARNIDAEGNTFNSSRQGVSVGRAADEAIRLNYDVNGATLPETNSRLYQSDIGRIVLTFRTHALNMLINLAMTFNQAIRTINENEPDAGQRRLVRNMAVKKLLYIYGSTYMLAGLKGLPLFGAAEVLASLVMGDDDEPYDLEQKVLDSVGTLGVNGPINELLNIDIASRTGFYGLLWRDDPKRLSEVGLPVYVLERAVGPTYGLVEAARRGFKDFSEGEIQRGAEAILPAPLRNLLKGMRYGIEGALTRDGLPITEDVSAYNSVMQTLGFAPADLAAIQGQRGATYEISEKLKQRRVSLLTNLYAARAAGNSEAVEQALANIRTFNAKNPAYRITMDSISRSFNERERRAREAIMGIYQPKSLRAATAQYVTRLDEEDGLIY